MQVKKSKILKILSVFIMMLLIILSAITVNYAGQKFNNRTFNQNGGTYHEAFQDKGSAIFNISWDSVKNKYYTAGSRNDYDAYIEGSKDGYCLNHMTADR